MHLRIAFLFKSIPNRSHFHDTFVNCLFCLDNLKYSRRKTGKINENVFGNIKVFLKHKLIRILIELTFGDVRISGESQFCKEFDKLIPHFCMAYISDVYFPGPSPTTLSANQRPVLLTFDQSEAVIRPVFLFTDG